MRQMCKTLVFMALLVCATSGCSSMANLTGRTQWIGTNGEAKTYPFGGIARNYESMSMLPLVILRGSTETRLEAAYLTPLLLVDLPLTIAGDIISLPWATYRWIHPIDTAVSISDVPQHGAIPDAKKR